MPIKGLTDGQGRLMVAGKLSIGTKEIRKTKDGREIEIPGKSDHFRFLIKNTETDKWCEDEEKTKEFGTPREVKITFLTSNIEEIFKTSLKYYTTSAKICSGNGETATRFIDCEPGTDPRKGIKTKRQIPCSLECPDYVSKKCKAVGDLYFILAEKITLGSCYVFSTTSTKSTEHILASLFQLAAVSGGRFAGVPVALKMVPTTNLYTDKDGNQQKSQSWTVFLELTAKDLKEFGKILQENAQLNGMLPAQLSEKAEIEHYSEFFPEPLPENLQTEFDILQENAELMVGECWFFSELQKEKKIKFFKSETDTETLKTKMNSFQDKIDFLNDAVKKAIAITGIGASKSKIQMVICNNLELITAEDTPESYAEKILKKETK